MERDPEETRLYAERTVGVFYDAITRDEQLATVAEIKRLMTSNSRDVVKMRRLYSLVDHAYRHSAGLVACCRGCAHCCHIAVSITAIEAKIIGDATDAKPQDVSRVAPRDPASFSMATPCPFLKNNECSIYEHRPFECRTNFNFDRDSYWCQRDNWDKPGAAVPKPMIAPIAMAYTALTQGANGQVLRADIRDFFPESQ